MISIVYNQLKEFVPTLSSIEQVDKTKTLSALGLNESDFESFQRNLQKELELNSDVSLLPFIKSTPLETLVNVLLTIKQAIVCRSISKNPKYEEIVKVAVIGIGLRLPGSINTIEKYWKSLVNGRNCVSPLPVNRHLHHFLNTGENLKPGQHYISKIAYYDNTPEVAEPTYFDPLFFGMNPNETNILDLKFRWIYETVYEALQDAAIDPDTLSESNTNVYVASGQDDEISRYSNEASPTGFSCLNGMSMHSVNRSSCPGRISFMYNLRGSGNYVDTACSSGLVATHDAYKDLKYGETDLAIVSAAHLQFLSDSFSILSTAKMASRNCRCATFDAEADGYVPGEGCVSVILKRFDDAVRDNNKIYGIINATATGQSGSRPSMSQPNAKGQVLVQKAVLAKAHLRPEDIDYMEAHGTGTSLGDKIETEALNEVYSGSHTKERPLVVASVKTNIGHTEEVSGLASLVKVLLSLQNKTVPPHLHFNKPNPLIDFESIPMLIPTERRKWTPVEGKKRTAVVSSYGLQGSISAAVVEEYNPPKKTPYGICETRHVLTISAKSHAALIASAEQYISLLESIGEDAPIADLCYTSNIGRQHMNHRYAVVGRNSVELLNELTNFVNQSKKTVRSLRTDVGMSFTGQGNAKPGIGEELFYTQPVFRKAMEKCDEVVKKVTGISIIDALYKPGFGQHLKKAQIAQPVLFAYEYAMSMLWKSWGINPTIVNGHSLGEIVAATVAGAIDFDLAIEFIIERARCMGEYGEKPGAMASVFEKESLLIDTIEEFGYEEEVSIAAVNGVTHTVISGYEEEIDDLTEYFSQMSVKTKKLDVTDAFHSPLMGKAVEKLNEWIESKGGDDKFRKEFKIKFISNVDGDIKSAGSRLSEGYWGKHALQTVRFTDGVTSLVKNDETTLAILEVGPAATLTNMSTRFIRETPELNNKGPNFVSSSVVGQNGEQTLMNAVCKLYMCGVNIDWRKFHERVDRATGERIPLSIYDLPLYPFQRSRYWLETDEEVRNNPLGYKNSKKRRDWKMYKDLSVMKGSVKDELIVTAPLSEEYIEYLCKNHVVMKNGCVPAAAYTEFIFNAMEAINKYTNGKEGEVFEIIDELLIRKPLNINEDSKVVLILKKKGSSISVFGKLDDEEEVKMLNATADALKNCENKDIIKTIPKPEEVRKLISSIMKKETTKPGSAIYIDIGKSTNYGGGFPSVESYAEGKDEEGRQTLVSHLVDKEKTDIIVKSGISQVYLFDASIHSCAGMNFEEDEKDAKENENSPFLPSSFENIVKFAPIPEECFVIHKTMPGTEKNARFTNFGVYDVKGNMVLSVDAFQTRRVHFNAEEAKEDNSPEYELYNLDFKEVELIQELYEIPSIVIVRDHRGYAEAFVDFLKTKSSPTNEVRYILVDMPNADPSAPMDGFMKNCLEKVGIKPESKGLLAFINFMALDFEDFNPTNVDGNSKEFQDKLRAIYEPNLMITQAFLRVVDEYNCKNIICYVTKNASNFWEGEVDPFQGILGGFSKSVWKEFINIRTFNLDIHREAQPKDVGKEVFDEMMSSINRYNVPFEVVYSKDNKRYQGAIRLENCSRLNPAGKGNMHLHGTIMITGGLGGVGTDLTRYLLEEQPDVTGLILTGRRPETDEKVAEALAKVRAINPKAKVIYATPNVASETEMRQLIDDIPKLGLEPLTGLVHTAGITDDGFIYNQNYERFLKLAHAKVEGNLCITHVTEGLNLDFTILFSSMAAFFGNRGQINYVSVNMFANKMALYYHNNGRKDVVSLELGAWPSGLTSVIKDRTLFLNPVNSINMLTNVLACAKDIYPITAGLPKVKWINVNDTTLHDPAFRSVRPTTRPMIDLSTMNDSSYVAGASANNENEGKAKRVRKNVEEGDDENMDDDDEVNEDNVFGIMETELKNVLQYGENDEIDPYQPLNELGIDSILMMELRTIFKNVTTINIPLVILSTQNICLFRLVEYVKAKLAKEKKDAEEAKKNNGGNDAEADNKKEEEDSNVISQGEVDQWISLVNKEDIEEPLNVFIHFPSADEGEVDYEPWIENLEDSLIFRMELPGYGKRKNEDPITNWDVLSKDMAQVIINYYQDNKFKECSSINFIGQSFGALLAWKTLLQIQIYDDEEKKVPIISTLIISRVFAPTIEHPITINLQGSQVVLSKLPVQQIAEIQAKLGNKNDFTSESLSYLIPILKTEYVMADHLNYDSSNNNLKMRTKLLLFSGKQDNIISEENNSLWKKEVSSEFNDFTQHIKMKGDYWFAQSSINKYFSNIMENLE